MPCVSNALMVGGGIAGLSAALALARLGVRCHVVEITDAPLGASLGLSGRATDALSELGIYDSCYATSTPFKHDNSPSAQHDAAGKLVSPAPSVRIGREPRMRSACIARSFWTSSRTRRDSLASRSNAP